MRVWLSGPRLAGIRFGVSLGPEDIKRRQTHARPRQLSTELMTGRFIYVLRAAHNMTQNRRHDQSHRSTGEPANGFGLF
jgi:hypothetical protein